MESLTIREIFSVVGRSAQSVYSLFISLHFLTIISSSLSTINDDIIVNTESGKIHGIRFYHSPSLIVPVDAFLGIPFAKPPIGHLRFRYPQAIEKWSYIFNATKFPNSCYQTPDYTFGHDFHGSNMWNPTTRVSEDCLYLNVWVPRTQPRLKKSAVMIWIHGGAFYSGTTALYLYDGKILAAESSVIVVSIGYRVGAFGFLSLNHSSAPGNAGLFDQLMALEWVQQNIKHFGGDPNNVTLFGEGAGSVSVSLHLLSPLSFSKFQRAILQSGVANMPWAVLSMEEATQRALELALEIIQCEYSDNMEVISDCLRAIPPQRLVDHQHLTRGPLQFPFLPVIDGMFLLTTPEEIIKHRTFKKCPILIGSNLNEGAWFIIYEIPQYVTLTLTTMNEIQFNDSIAIMFPYYPRYNKNIKPLILRAIKHQYTHWVDRSDEELNLKALDASLADSQFFCPVNTFSQAYARTGEYVYSYLFSQRYSSNPWPKWMGVLHGDEIMFMFGEAIKPGRNFTEDEKALSKKMMRFWTNFAKTGDPNQVPGQTRSDEWPLHTPSGREYLELNTRFLNAPDPSLAIHRGPRIKECAFWDDFLPHLVQETERLERTSGECEKIIPVFSSAAKALSIECCSFSVLFSLCYIIFDYYSRLYYSPKT